MWRLARVLAPAAFVLGLLIGQAGDGDAGQVRDDASVAPIAGLPTAPSTVTETETETATSTATRTKTRTKTKTITETARSLADPDGGSGGGSTYYANCDEARADGAAPVHVGDPGYGRHLDRDGDGTGCE
jgi:hypothetical protein